MPYNVNVGDAIPAFRIKDNDSYELTDEDLVGSPVVIYFYPKDFTPGCTTEACDFRDHMDQLDMLDVLVLGISPDNAESHDKFTSQYDLNYTLLSDEKLELCKKFDVLREGNKVERTTFVIDSEGIIQWIERPVNTTDHAKRVIQAVQELEESDSFI